MSLGKTVELKRIVEYDTNVTFTALIFAFIGSNKCKVHCFDIPERIAVVKTKASFISWRNSVLIKVCDTPGGLAEISISANTLRGAYGVRKIREAIDDIMISLDSELENSFIKFPIHDAVQNQHVIEPISTWGEVCHIRNYFRHIRSQQIVSP